MTQNESKKPQKQVISISKKRKTALVLSGGAAKAGAFHLGVALALREHGFSFQSGIKNPGSKSPEAPKPSMEITTYVGSSAGSIICSLLASGYTLENIFNSFLGRESNNPVDCFPKPLPKLTYPKMLKLRPELAKEQLKQFLELRKIFKVLATGDWGALADSHWIKISGLFSTKGIEQYLREEVLFSNSFEDFLPDLFVVGTQLDHSRKIVFGRYAHQMGTPHGSDCHFVNEVSVSEACAASTALPLIYTPYPLASKDGKTYYYIDGEVRDTLSTHVAIDAGADLVISSYTHQPYHYQKGVGSLVALGIAPIVIQSIYLLVERKIEQHRRYKERNSRAIDEVLSYLKREGIAENHQKRICAILEDELYTQKNVDIIYIHPRENDASMFLKHHFSLSPKTMADIVKSGFRAAMDVLRTYEFTDKT